VWKNGEVLRRATNAKGYERKRDGRKKKANRKTRAVLGGGRGKALTELSFRDWNKFFGSIEQASWLKRYVENVDI